MHSKPKSFPGKKKTFSKSFCSITEIREKLYSKSPHVVLGLMVTVPFLPPIPFKNAQTFISMAKKACSLDFTHALIQQSKNVLFLVDHHPSSNTAEVFPSLPLESPHNKCKSIRQGNVLKRVVPVVLNPSSDEIPNLSTESDIATTVAHINR